MTRYMPRTLVMAVSALALTAGLAFAAPDDDKPARRAATQPAEAHRHGEKPGPATRPAHSREHRGDREAGARGGPETREQAKRMMRRQLFGNLELNDEQQREIREILDAYNKQRGAWWEEHRDEIREIRQQVHAARQADDQAELQRIREQLRELMQAAPQPASLQARFEEVLSDEQMEQLKKNWQRLREAGPDRGERPDRPDRREGDRRERGERGEARERGGEGDGPRDRRNRRPRERQGEREQREQQETPQAQEAQ